jgi:hypothetical protein
MKEGKALRVVYYTDKKKKNGAEALVVFELRCPRLFYVPGLHSFLALPGGGFSKYYSIAITPDACLKTRRLQCNTHQDKLSVVPTLTAPVLHLPYRYIGVGLVLSLTSSQYTKLYQSLCSPYKPEVRRMRGKTQPIRYRKPKKGKIDAFLRLHHREVEQEKYGLIDYK